MRKTDNRNPFKLSVLATALALIPLGAHAAGLGRLTVNSALGQPLRAEIEVTANRDEMSSLSARLAPLDAFRNAGIEYTSALSAIRFSVDKRPNGKVFLVVSSDRPFNEPFVDMLVEMNWASGRLVREYTFLLDPPEVLKRAETPAPVAAPQVRNEAAPAAQPAPARVPAPAPEPRTAAPAPQPVAPAPRVAQPAPAEPAAAGTRQVVKGDTLAKIASDVKPAGVNLDQMLAALFLSNKEAFDGGNMNRLRAGKILRIPDSESVMAVEPAEAHKMVIAQAVDFNAYRKKLAAAAAAEPAKEEAPRQSASGKITPKVEEKAPPVAAGKDKLEVSRTEAGKDGKGAKGASEEERIARDKELKEANARIAALEKNVADLKKLAEMKAAAKPETPAPAKPAEPTKPAPMLAVPAKPVEAPKPTEATKPAEAAKPAEPAKPAEAPKPAAPKPAVKAPAPPPPPPSFMEEHPEIVFGGGAIVALLLGYLGYNAWRRKRQAAPEAEVGGEAASSVFGTAGGQTVDTGEALPTDFSQQPDTEGDEGVDPVAEADVYIAYGRDTQAEEILLEALKTDPTRIAIHVKLLEIYAARKDLASFESVARELYGLTGGAGADWERAQLLGRSIDPVNPLYGGSGAAAPAAAEEAEGLDMTATVMTSAAALQPAVETPAPRPEAPPAAEQATPAEELPASLDFDLDLGAPPEAEAPAPAAETPAADEGMSLDFDLGSAPEAETPAAAADAESAPALDFELDTPLAEAPAAESPAAEEPAAATDANALDFDFDLSEPKSEPAAEAPAELQMPSLDLPLSADEPEKASEAAAEAPASEPEMPPLDLSGIDLDLDETPAAAEAPAAPAMPETTVIVDDPEVATKLELAQAYEEMGDKEGARELLNEVLNEGSSAQQEAARQKLAALG